MSFIDKIKTVVTGKNKEEREYEAAQMKDIRKAAQEAALEERRNQAIRVARQKESIIADAQLRKVKMAYAPKQSTPQGTGFFRGFSQYYGTARSPGSSSSGKVRYIKKGKSYVKVRGNTSMSRQLPQKSFIDIIGGSGFNSGKRYDVLGI